MATLTLSPFVKFSEYDSNGDPCSGFKLFTYQAGTAIKQATYQDVSGSSANTNPIILDAAGQATIFLLNDSSYKYVLAPADDTDPPTSPIWTQDDINSGSGGSSSGVDISGTAGENQTAGDLCYVSQGDGGLTPGSWYKCDSDVDYSTINAIEVGFAINTVTLGQSNTYRTGGLMTGLAGLVAGTTYFASSTAGALSTSQGTYPRRAGIAASATSLYVASGENAAGATNAGNVSVVAQSFTGVKTFAVQPKFYFGNQTGDVSGISGVCYATATPVTSTGTVLETLGQFAFDANTFNVDGKGMRMRCWGKFAATANNKQPVIVFGTNTLFSVTTASNNKTWDMECVVLRVSNTNATATVKANIGGSAVNTAAAGVLGSAYQVTWDTMAAIDFTTNHSISMRTTDSTASGGTTLDGFVVEMLGA